MNAVQEFVNGTLGCSIRVTDRAGEPWFVAKDVAEALGYANTEQAVRTHCKGVLEISTPSAGGMQRTKIIPESDLYRLIMRSQKPEAEAFQDWVVGEVLPSIRKTGAYGNPNPTNDPFIALRLLQLDAEKQLAQQAQQIKQLEHRIIRDEQFVSVVGYCSLNGLLGAGREEAKLIGMKLTALAKSLGVPVTKIPDSKWGQINAYPSDFLDEYFLDIYNKYSANQND